MRIGIFSDAYLPLISGVVTSVNSLRKGLEALGHDVYIITPIKPEETISSDRKVIYIPGIKVPRSSLKGYRYTVFVRRYLKKIANLNLDIIHIHTEFSIGKLGLLVAKQLKIPYIYTNHTSYQDYTHYISKSLTKFFPNFGKKLAGKVNNKYSSQASYTIVPSKKIYQKVIDLNHDGKFEIIPTGLDLSKFYQENFSDQEVKQLKKRLDIKDNEFIALVVTRIAKEKSIEDIIGAFVIFHQQNQNSKLIIVGDGPTKNQIENLIKKHTASSYIKMLGYIAYNDVGTYYQVADVFLNASTTETQGLTFIEAQAASLPLIVRHDTVFDDFIFDGVNGLFFDDINMLVSKLIEVSQNPDKLKNMASNAKGAVALYDVNLYASKVLKLYQESLKK